jgi:DNA modification methylase
MPLDLSRKLVRFLSDLGQLVVDPCAGSMTTPLACELEGRRWAATDVVFDFVRGGAERFTDFAGYELALDAT